MTTGIIGKCKGTLVAYGIRPGPVRVKNPGEVPADVRDGELCVFAYVEAENAVEYVGQA